MLGKKCDLLSKSQEGMWAWFEATDKILPGKNWVAPQGPIPAGLQMLGAVTGGVFRFKYRSAIPKQFKWWQMLFKPAV